MRRAPGVRSGIDARRLQDHRSIAAELGSASDAQLLGLREDPALITQGHGRVRVGEWTTFAKLVPVTELELRPEHHGSTANLFHLPPRYHYRIGSRGFGVWRELAVHRLANEWVADGRCSDVALLHHHRVLPIVACTDVDESEKSRWGQCPEINARIDAARAASSSLVLFLEYFPLTLHAWLAVELGRTSDPGRMMVRIEQRVHALLDIVHGQGVLHMDAHLENILTDGDQLHLCDFGLAIAMDFELGADERQFAGDHQDFDRRTATSGLLHAVVSHYAPSDDWRQRLLELDRWEASMPEPLRAFVRDRAEVALETGAFYRRLALGDELAAGSPS